MLSDYSEMKLEINNKIEFEKCTTILKINNAVLNN